MENMVNLMWDVRKKCRHGRILCSELPCGFCHKNCQKDSESVQSSYENDAKAAPRTVSVFAVKKVALKYTRAPGNYTLGPGLTNLLHKSFAGTTVHCWSLALEKKTILGNVYYSDGDGTNSEKPVEHGEE